MPRRPFSFNWKAPVAFLTAATALFIIALWTQEYIVAAGTVMIAAIGYAVYATGESSGLPGTAGDHNRNIRT